jgi:hypothetical protein
MKYYRETHESTEEEALEFKKLNRVMQSVNAANAPERDELKKIFPCFQCSAVKL